MTDQSHLDRKYFIDPYVFNCPFCKRNNVSYSLAARIPFDWSNSKKCKIVEGDMQKLPKGLNAFDI